MTGLGATLATFVVVCLATAFVCTAIKEDEDIRLATGTLRLFGVMTGGIVMFAGVIQLVSWLAS